jgi:hypothetical protein
VSGHVVDRDRGLAPIDVARLRARVLYESEEEQRLFVSLFRLYRSTLRAGGDVERRYRTAFETGRSIEVAAIIEASASLRRKGDWT